MPAKPRKIPSYRLHKPTGQAVVRLNGHDFYLGKHGSETSQEAYHRRIAEWLATGQHCPPAPSKGRSEVGPKLQFCLRFQSGPHTTN